MTVATNCFVVVDPTTGGALLRADGSALTLSATSGPYLRNASGKPLWLQRTWYLAPMVLEDDA